MLKRVTNTEMFVERLNSLRPNCFDISNAIYTGSQKDLILICLRCNIEFNAKPNGLFDKRIVEPCRFCSTRSNLLTLKDYQNVCGDKGTYILNYTAKNSLLKMPLLLLYVYRLNLNIIS